MYTIDQRDRVVPLPDIPHGSTGAPGPMIASDEGRLVVCYYLPIDHPTFDGTNPKVVDPEVTESTVCVLEAMASNVLFGAPNDEALPGHPLYSRGLSYYGVFEVLHSSWLRLLDDRNRICFPNSRARSDTDRHIIVCFHDSTLEFTARSWKTRTERGSLTTVFAKAIQSLSRNA